MAVAKSYQKMEVCGEPFKENGKFYVIVRDPAKGSKKRVRWYSDAEYERMYGSAPKKLPSEQRKNPLGFSKGYVTIFKGPVDKNEEWFQHSKARHCTLWGWYFSSEDEVPVNELPEGITPIELKWEEVSNILDDKNKVRELVHLKLYAGEQVPLIEGRKGERISLAVIIVQVETFENKYGKYYIYTMEDSKGILYIWKTQSQQWEANQIKVLKATIKDIDDKYVILTRCMEVK